MIVWNKCLFTGILARNFVWGFTRSGCVAVDTGEDVNLMSRYRYVMLYNDERLKCIKLSDIKLGVWGDNQTALLNKCNI